MTAGQSNSKLQSFSGTTRVLFVHNITEDPEDRAIVGAIISLANGLNMQTIAEGVETEDQLVFPRAHGCDGVQGYCFSKPLPVDQFEEFVRRGKVIAAGQPHLDPLNM